MNAHDPRAQRIATTFNDPRWLRVTHRDASADGRFYYGVRTTGVYCRPSCAARTAKPENVAFYTTQDAARDAGLRPCKRCKPERLAPAKFTKRIGETCTNGSNKGSAASRNDTAADEVRFAVGECFLGALLVARSGAGLCAILIGEDAHVLEKDLQHRFPRANLFGPDAALQHDLAQIAAFLENPTRDLRLPLDPRGTPFQRRVWQALREIPPRSCVSYAHVARCIGAPNAMRAVAQACAANHLAVAIPCHRVVRSDGTVSGYAWGVERKRALLVREAQA
ncbi:MAG TPA: methylated-DNA--[protein]-cysteine S-methyltransferase [Dokdonella sp.]